MTDLDDFLATVRGLGVKLWVEGDKLKLRAPEGVLNPDLTGAIKERKAEILALLLPDPVQTIPPLPVQESYELSAAQRRLWVLTQFPEASAAYNIPLHQILEGSLDRTALETAFARLVERHDSLRTTFVTVAGEPRQVVHPRFAVPLGFRDISDAGVPEDLARQLGREDAGKPFDLATGPLLRACLLRLARDRHVLLFTISHIIADGVSLAVLARDLGRLYEAAISGSLNTLPELAFGYPAYAAWQNRLLTSGLMTPHQAYWHATLAGELPVLALPTDFPRPPLQGFRGRELFLTLPLERLEALQAFCRPRNASLFMVLHAALKVLLFSYTGQEDIIIGCAVAGREHADLADQVGFYLNTLALRSTICGDMPFETFFAETARQTKEAFDHQIYPFDQLVDELNIPRDLRRFPLFDVMLVLQNQDEPGLGLDGIRSRPVFEHPETSKFDLTFTAKATPTGLILGVEYNTDLFEPASVQAMADSFVALLEALVTDPRRPIRDLPVMTPDQRAALLAFGRGPDLDLPACSLFDLIEAQVRRTPDRCAVADQSAEWTYAELIRAAENHAARLQRIGVKPGDRVGLMLERAAALPAALLGILRTGAAYVPLDPGFPADRLAYVAADAGIGALLTQASLSALWPPGVPICRIDDAAPAEPPSSPADIDPSACAYILYTSGSTGRPKGVRISHRSAVNFLLAMQRELGIGTDARLLAVTTIAFDIAVLELFLPLTLGARVLVCDRETAADGHALARRLAATGADWMQATPATWRMLFDAGWPGKPDLNALCGGEALPADLAEALLPVTAALWNLYGPTETTVWSTCGRVEPGAPVGLGRPIANTRLYVLDDRQRMVPPGVAGELHIGGAGVTMDYWMRPDLTADRFLPALAVDPEGGRTYRTGDRVRWAASGRLHYLGRFDQQIKLRGYRIEPGEIEAVMTEHPGVSQAVLDLRDGDRLIAWYVGADAGHVPAAELRAHVRSQLPAYMVPAAFVPVPRLPLTANGKVDRKALPEPDPDRDWDLDRGVAYEPPRTEWEHRLARLWQDVLKVPCVGVNDNFFELGGHSLKAATFTARLQSETGTCLDLIDVFRQPTLAGLARLAEERGTGALLSIGAAASGPGIRPATAEELEILERL
jgi:amino acid adenylation domain-containing protein